MLYTEDRFICNQCGSSEWNMLMLQDTVWKIISKYKREFLCVPCMEKRMGRKFKESEIKPNLLCNDRWWN